MDHGRLRWADVMANSAELFKRLFEQGRLRLPSSKVQVLSLGERRLEVFAEPELKRIG